MFCHTFGYRDDAVWCQLRRAYHSTPKMTLLYLSSRRPIYDASSAPLAPSRATQAATSTTGLKPDLIGTVHAVEIAQYVTEMFRRTLSDSSRAEPAMS
jgi:hypothetical protein